MPALGREFSAIAEQWDYCSDGCELLAFCPECAKREFAADVAPVPPLGGLTGDTPASSHQTVLMQVF